MNGRRAPATGRGFVGDRLAPTTIPPERARAGSEARRHALGAAAPAGTARPRATPMPIPFRDQDDVEDLGVAAYLRLEADADRPGYRGALFQKPVPVSPSGSRPVHSTPNRHFCPSRTPSGSG